MTPWTGSKDRQRGRARSSWDGSRKLDTPATTIKYGYAEHVLLGNHNGKRGNHSPRKKDVAALRKERLRQQTPQDKKEAIRTTERTEKEATDWLAGKGKGRRRQACVCGR